MYLEIQDILDKIDYSSLFPEFYKCDYIINTENETIINGKRYNCNTAFDENSVYCMDGVNYAVWNMLNNSKYWDAIDVACGLLHEMFHCFQIKKNIFRTLDNPYHNENIEIVRKELEIVKALLVDEVEDNKFKEYVLDRYNNDSIKKRRIEFAFEELEGIALYVELLAKKQIKNVPINSLLLSYYEYIFKTTQQIEFLRRSHYFIGAVTAYQLDKANKSWKSDYLINRFHFDSKDIRNSI